MFAARQSWRRQGGQAAGEVGSLRAVQVAIDVSPRAASYALCGCREHYGCDIMAFRLEDRAQIVNAVQVALNNGDSAEICKAVAAIKLREIYPHVNGIKERA